MFASFFFTGLFAGAVHVLAGPDHLSAVAPLAMESRGRAWITGLRWGIGHSAGVTLIAGLAFFFREILPLDSLSSWSERLVGFVLIGIGLWGLRRAFSNQAHIHEHEHDGSRHAHFHVHRAGQSHDKPKAHAHGHAAIAVGALHGLAGSTHLIAILPALAMPSRSATAIYLAGVIAGTIVAMMLFAWFVGKLAQRASGYGDRLYRGLAGSFSGAAIAIGLFWIWSTA